MGPVHGALAAFAMMIVAFAAPASASASEVDDSHEVLARAAAYLWSQQAEDGGWHSPQYGVLRSGQALTPYVLRALMQVPKSMSPRPAGGVARALDFIRTHVNEEGALGKADPDVLEYPVYATSYGLRCLLLAADDPRLARDADAALIERMHLFLMLAQFDVDAKFTAASPAFGGWGFDVARGPGDPGHMDLAHTRRALEALRAARPRFEAVDCEHAFKQSQHFLRVVQQRPEALAEQPRIVDAAGEQVEPLPFDGGFYFSPVVLTANKGTRRG
jgi:hypothetical protein